MLVGKCTKCGKSYIGWALSRPEHHTCLECGAILLIRNMGENYQPDRKTFAASQRNGIAELIDSADDTIPQIFL